MVGNRLHQLSPLSCVHMLGMVFVLVNDAEQSRRHRILLRNCLRPGFDGWLLGSDVGD